MRDGFGPCYQVSSAHRDICCGEDRGSVLDWNQNSGAWEAASVSAVQIWPRGLAQAHYYRESRPRYILVVTPAEP